MEVPDYIPFQMLKEEIINTQLSLKAAGGFENKNEDDITKLTQLYQIVEQKEQEWQSTVMAQQQMEMQQQQAQMASQAGVPNAGPNVLSQEAQMTQVPPMQGEQIQPDMDMETQQGTAANGGWNQPYQMQ